MIGLDSGMINLIQKANLTFFFKLCLRFIIKHTKSLNGVAVYQDGVVVYLYISCSLF